MNTITYTPHGVCSRKIEITLDDNNFITAFTFTGGCSGNTHGVAALIVGMTAQEAYKRLNGIRCGGKASSCPDQLAQALKPYITA